MESLYYGDREIKKIMHGGEQVWPEPTKHIEHIELTAVTTASNQTVKINKYFTNSFDVDWGDGSPIATLTADTAHTYTTAGEYKIKLTLASGASRWTFGNVNNPLVPKSGTTASNIYISSMPSLADYFGANATNPGDFFFANFNRDGALTSLPKNSFDTSNITTVGNNFFGYFNYYGALTSLPERSFNTSNITTVGNNFFSSFNRNGALTSLPENSFDTSNITTVGDWFFYYFNDYGALTSLPENSFDTSNITTVGTYFFAYFNRNGALTSLPENSFDTSNITTVGNYFFSNFNRDGALTSLPKNSFDTSNITTVGNNFFVYFNRGGKLTKQVGGIQIKNASTGAIAFYYWNGSSTVSETVSPGNSFNGYTVG